MSKNILQPIATVSYMVRKLNEKYPDAQISKNVIQKIGYILTRENIIDINYSMYHDGLHSLQVSNDLNSAENIGTIEMNWVPNKGYFITSKSDKLESIINNDDKLAIDQIIDKYNSFNIIELAIITTALFIKDNFWAINNEELIRIIASLKPKYDINQIRNILERCDGER